MSAAWSQSVLSSSGGYAPALLPPAFCAALQTLFPGSQCLLGAEECLVYERDANFLALHPPQAIVIPETVEQLAGLLQLAERWQVPLVARGAGTGQSGGAVAACGGVVVHFSRMNRLLQLDAANRRALVEPGLTNAALNQAAAAHGLWYAADPSSLAVCTMGGNWAENAGGIHCVKYGVTRQQTLAVEWVTGNGQRVWSQPGVDGLTGLDTTSLLVGSEGTLALMTRAWVRLLPAPCTSAVVLAAFATLEAAADAVSALMQSGLDPAAVELMDALTVACVRQAYAVELPYNCQALLLVEWLGHAPDEVSRLAQAGQTVLQAAGASSLQTAYTPQAIERLWQARRGAAASYGLMTPAFYVLDCVIPRLRLAQALQEITAVAEQFALQVANVFHAGDGNLHPHLFFDPSQPTQKERVKHAAEAITRLCVALGGTLSGEHGIGLEKRDWMPAVFNAVDLQVMRQVKRAFDPNDCLNPHKIIPTKAFCGEGRHRDPHGEPLGLRPQALALSGLWI